MALPKIKGSFPHGIKTIQGEKLYELAKGSCGVIVEIGSFVGKSTIYMALGSIAGNQHPVVAIDPWKKDSTKQNFLKHIDTNKVSHLIFPIQEFSDIALQKYHKDTLESNCPIREGIGLLFIDGAHSYQAVKKDLKWLPLVKKSGVVAFHDYHEKLCPGVAKALDEFFITNNGELEIVDNVGTLLVCRKLGD
jgi:predicted O-methyltransferase YrrM